MTKRLTSNGVKIINIEDFAKLSKKTDYKQHIRAYIYVNLYSHKRLFGLSREQKTDFFVILLYMLQENTDYTEISYGFLEGQLGVCRGSLRELERNNIIELDHRVNAQTNTTNTTNTTKPPTCKQVIADDSSDSCSSKPKTDLKKKVPSKSKYTDSIEKIVLTMNKILGTKSGTKNKRTVKDLTKLLDSGYKLEDFEKVVIFKKKQWKGTTMEKHLCPETLFRESNFEGYLDFAKAYGGDHIDMLRETSDSICPNETKFNFDDWG